MTDTKTLIALLSSEVHEPTKLLLPGYWGGRLVAALAIYAVAAQFYLGLRPDLAMQFSRPAFAAETALLALLFLASTIASVLGMYPDAYQKPKYLLLPYAACLLLVFLVALQMFMPPDARMVVRGSASHAMECVLCIGSVSVIPGALIFALLRKGANVRHWEAGTFAVLGASAIGCLTLRLAEADDSLMHLAVWHYLPTLFFSALGAVIGARLLKW